VACHLSSFFLIGLSTPSVYRLREHFVRVKFLDAESGQGFQFTVLPIVACLRIVYSSIHSTDRQGCLSYKEGTFLQRPVSNYMLTEISRF
jgi:hypothetical protein